MWAAVMSVCLPVDVPFIDHQITSLYGNVTTSLIVTIYVCMWVHSTWGGHLYAFDITRIIVLVNFQYVTVNTQS